jgi:putative phage-type endonuclease
VNSEQRTAWLESRRNGIGSSDVAKILGLSQWGNALNVYLAKVAPSRAEEMTPSQEWGHRLEPVVSAAIMDRHGWTLAKVPTLRHAEHEFLIASPDRENESGELVEIKTTSRAEGWGEPETAEIPEQYWLQVQHQMEVADRDLCWVFVLIGNCDFRRYRVARDDQYLPTVIDPLREFWSMVEASTPPEPDWSHPSTLAAVQRLYVPKPGTVTDLNDHAKTMADEYERLGAEAKEIADARDEYKARLIAALGEFEQGNLPDGRCVTRKQVTRSGYEVKPSTYLDFRIKKAKGAK